MSSGTMHDGAANFRKEEQICRHNIEP